MISQVLKAINISFSKKLKLNYLFVFLFNIFSGILEVLSIALIIPFTMLLFQKDELFKNETVTLIYNFFNFSTQESFVIIFSIFFLIILIVSNVFSVINVWLISYFTYKLDYNLIIKLFKNFLYLGYENKVNINSADLISKMTIQIKRFVEGVVNSLMIIFQKIITILFILVFLSFVNLEITLYSLITIFLIYIIFFKLINNLVYKKGSEMTSIFSKRQRLISETIFGIKEVILYNLQEKQNKNLNSLSKKLTKNVAFVRTIAVFPRYFLEIIIFLILVPSSIIFFLNDQNDLNSIIPILSSFIFGLYKLSPAVQSIFSAFVNIKTDLSAFEAFKGDLKLHQETDLDHVGNPETKQSNIIFNSVMNFENINFSYKNSLRKKILKNLNIEIKKNEITGIFGHSGSGKTTCLNLILGFLKPTSGKILIDNQNQVHFNNFDWMKKIGYVSQFTFLFDDTLKNNITMFEKNPDNIRLIDSIEKSGLTNYFNKNDRNLDLTIGERGSQLSGGEIQRIGLARALYRQPDLLVLDEFTSSLDTKTEKEILENIKKLKKKLTIVLSTHKFSILDLCDTLYQLHNGELKKKGKPNDFKNFE